MIYILTATYKNQRLAKNLTSQLRQQTRKDWKLIIINDKDNIFWWTGSMNLALKKVLPKLKDGDAVLFTNVDVVIGKDFLDKIFTASRKYHAIIGSIVRDIDNPNTVLHSGILIDPIYLTRREAAFDKKPIEVDALSTRGTIVPAEIIRSLGFLDQKNFPHYTSDYDYFYRAKKLGYKLIIDPNISLLTKAHHPQRSVIFKLFSRHHAGNLFNETRFLWKHSRNPLLKVVNLFRFYFRLIFR